jgi:spore maturation protein SpmA
MFGFLSKVIKPVANVGRKIASSISISGIGSKVSSLVSSAYQGLSSAYQGLKSMMGLNQAVGRIGKEAVIQKGGKVITPIIRPKFSKVAQGTPITGGLFPPKPL